MRRFGADSESERTVLKERAPPNHRRPQIQEQLKDALANKVSASPAASPPNNDSIEFISFGIIAKQQILLGSQREVAPGMQAIGQFKKSGENPRFAAHFLGKKQTPL